MGFVSSRRHGQTWDDAKKLHEILMDFDFQTTGSNESHFERELSSVLRNQKKNFNNEVITQTSKTTKVNSVYCFGKNHRPDMTIGEDGIAIEMKFISYDGLKSAIGQGYFYRLRYKYVFLVMILSDKRKDVYEEIERGKEKDLEDILQYLAEELNVFTYIAPSFVVDKTAMRKIIPFFNHKD